MPHPALAWGDEGHKIIALIAQHYSTSLRALRPGPSLPELTRSLSSEAGCSGTTAAETSWLSSTRRAPPAIYPEREYVNDGGPMASMLRPTGIAETFPRSLSTS
jgi:hypothetical protein